MTDLATVGIKQVEGQEDGEQEGEHHDPVTYFNSGIVDVVAAQNEESGEGSCYDELVDEGDEHSVAGHSHGLTSVLVKTVDEAVDLVLLGVEVLHRFEVIQGVSSVLVVAELLSRFVLQHFCLPRIQAPGYQQVEDHSAQKDDAVVPGQQHDQYHQNKHGFDEDRDHVEEQDAGYSSES